MPPRNSLRFEYEQDGRDGSAVYLVRPASRRHFQTGTRQLVGFVRRDTFSGQWRATQRAYADPGNRELTTQARGTLIREFTRRELALRGLEETIEREARTGGLLRGGERIISGSGPAPVGGGGGGAAAGGR